YLCAHMVRLFEFYNFETAIVNWKNYQGRQAPLDYAANILINGSKKYTSKRQRPDATRKNRRKRKK
ncbi:MAG: hypothetical protein EXX96DRAFT_452780, partial [Benjaminiella poitrasii]